MIVTMNSGRVKVTQPHRRSLSQFYTNIEDIPLATRYWPDTAPIEDQGDSFHCVAHAWRYWLLEYGKNEANGRKVDIPTARELYAEITPQTAGAISLTEMADCMVSQGHIAMYAWANSIPELAFAVANISPVIAGISWYEGMRTITDGSLIMPVGRYCGEHAVLIIGVDVNDKEEPVFMIKNSMGMSWGERGYAWIGFDDMKSLIHDGGEFCIPFRHNGRGL